MELALESYDVCAGWLQSKPKTSEGKNYAVNLPNLRVDETISLDEVCIVLYCIVLLMNSILPKIDVSIYFIQID